MNKKKIKLKELLILSFRTFRSKPQRVFLTIAGMSIGIATVLLLVSLGYGFQYILIGKLMTTEDSLITMDVSYPSESNLFIEQSVIDSLKKYENISEVSPVSELSGEISLDGGPGLLVNTIVVDPKSYYRLSGIVPNIGKYQNETGISAVLYSQSLIPLGLTADGSSLNKNLDFKVNYTDKDGNSNEIKSNVPVPLSGIISDDSTTPTAIVSADAFPNHPSFYQKVLVKAKNVDVLESVRDRLINDGFTVSARVDIVSQARKVTNIITLVLGVFGITALVVSAIGMFNTMIVGFMERIYEVGILKSIGATDIDVKKLFLFESSIMGFLGGIGGIILGVGGGQILNLLLSFLATRLGGSSIKLFSTPWWFVAVTIVFSIFIGFVSGWWPARKAAILSPKEAFTRK